MRAADEVDRVVDTNEFFRNLADGKLAQVSWLIPSDELSEHPDSPISRGQAYVTEIVNAVMRSPYWKDSVIFLTWDDWGGFYDHVPPQQLDLYGLGFRVPLLVVSPLALSTTTDTAYTHYSLLATIEDGLGVARLGSAVGIAPIADVWK